MPRALLAIIAIAVLAVLVPRLDGSEQADVTCAAFNTWPAAQTMYEANPAGMAPLDPDADDIACPDLPRDGIAPILWTDRIPPGAEAAGINRVIDGDTFDVTVNGVTDTVRMYRIDAPEFGGNTGPEQCGAREATGQLAAILRLVPEETVFLEYDVTHRDQYDRRLAWVWFERGGDIYMVNEAMARSGFATSETYEPDDRYQRQLNAAEQFATRHQLGVHERCGGFGHTVDPTPPRRETPPAMPTGTGSGCEPAYPDVCIPLRSETGDLDCGDITERRFRVLPPDPHNFDSDGDGSGCEGG